MLHNLKIIAQGHGGMAGLPGQKFVIEPAAVADAVALGVKGQAGHQHQGRPVLGHRAVGNGLGDTGVALGHLGQVVQIDEFHLVAFSGCSAESEASFETILFLAKKLDELGLPCILTIEGARHKIAQTIVENTAKKNQSILALDSMQSTTSKDVAQGTAYLSVMEKNLDVLTDALG